MEQKQRLPTNKVFSFLRIILFIIRKNISKTKLSLDLNMIIKRGKIARKALQNLMLHHRAASTFNQHSPNFTFPPPLTQEHEFSSSSSPVYPLSLFTTNKKHHKKSATALNNGRDEIIVDPAVIKALEMLTSAAASPVVRQLRITDSPFPLSNEEEDSYVDEAAERFIMKFYNDLRRQG